MKLLVVTGLLLIWIPVAEPQETKTIDSLLQQLEIPNNDTSRIDILNKIAGDYLYHDPDKIYVYAKKALKKSEAINYQKGIAEAFNNIGIYYRTKGIYEEAIDYFFQSLKIMGKIKNEKGIARSYNLIGIIYYYLENYDLSLKYYSKALELNKKQDDKKWIAGNSNNIGMIYERKGNYEKALEYYLKSMEMSNEIGNRNWLANIYGNLGSLYMKMNNPEGLGYLLRRLELKTDLGDTAGIGSANNMIGEYFLYNKKPKKALPYLKKSYQIAKITGSFADLDACTQNLSRAYASLKDYKQAFFYQKLFKAYHDSLDLQTSTQKITRLQLQNEFRRKQQDEILVYEKSRLRHVAVAFGLIFLILLIIALYWNQRSKVKKHRLESNKLQIEYRAMQEELQFKEKMLEDNLNYLLNKNELLTSLIENLNNLRPDLSSDNQAIVNEIILELQSGIQDEMWEEFELRFKQINNEFYINLKNRFPELSANETKLCAYLRLNMTTREISALTGQSIKSIETARSRLRKKIKLSNKEIGLPEFLNQI